MRKLVTVSLKAIIFFIGWVVCVGIIPIPATENVAIWRFWAELFPLLSIIGITAIFWFIDKKKIKLHLIDKPVYNLALGIIVGTIWLGVSFGILTFIGVIQLNGSNSVSMIWLWLLSAFINTIMQEMLVRGYLYQMIKSNYNTLSAVIVSTGVFTFAKEEPV